MSDVTNYEQLMSGDFQEQVNPEQYAMLLSPTPQRGPRTNSRYVGQAAMISGNPYEVEAFDMAASSEDTKAYTKERSEEFYQQRMNDISNNVNAALASSPDVLNAVIEGEQEQVKRIEAMKHNPVGSEQAYVMMATPTGTSTVQEQKAMQLALANDLSEMVEEQGWLETAADFASYFIPFKEAIDIQDIPGAVADKAELAEIAGADLETIVGAWKTLPVDRQVALAPPLFDAIQEATSTLGITDGNTLKTVGILKNFFKVEGAAEIRAQQVEDIAFSAFDFVPVDAIRAMKAVEKVTAAKVLKQAVDTTIEQTSATRIATEAGDVESAARHTTASMLDEPTAIALGTNQIDAAMSAMPIETSEWFRHVVDDDALPSAVASEMNNIAVKASGFSRSLTTESELMQIGVMSGPERNQVVKGFTEHMTEVGEDYLTQNIEMDNLRITKEDSRGFEYSYTLKDKNHPTTPGGKDKLKLRTGKVQFKVNEVTGDFSATVNDPVAQSVSKIVSPTTWSVTNDSGDFGLEVKRALQADDLAAAYTAKANDLLDWAIDPVKGALDVKARSRIDLVLEKGDEFINEGSQVRGRVFTPSELAAGIETKAGTVRLVSPKEVESYYRFRMYADATSQVEDFVLRRELELAGMKDIKLYALGNPTGDSAAVKNVRMAATSVGKPFDNVNAALASVRGKTAQGIWDDGIGRTVDITDDYIRQVYDEGDVVVRLKKDWNTKGTGDLDVSGEMVQYVRVQQSHVNDLPPRVLNYKPGYVPKINEARFVVSQRVPVIARNRPGMSRSQALRAFDSASDAKAFREEQITKYAEKNDVPVAQAEELFPEVGNIEDLPLSTRLEEAVGSHSGLYHGTRSKDELLFGLSGQDLSRVSPLESFQRHTKHLGSFVAQNEVRIAREKRWLNTIRKDFPEVTVEGFENTVIPVNTAKGRAAERIRTQIRDWNGIPTREEDLFNGMWQRIHDWSLDVSRNRFGYKNKESVKSIQRLMHVNPYSAIKSAVMHNLLGMFNVAQLYTQASSALISVSKLPHVGPEALTNSIPFAILDNIRNSKALQPAYDILKKGGVLKDETIDTYNAWQRTGLKEAVYNNSDIARVTSTGLGLTKRLLEDADFLSLYLYRAGELANRRITFSAEYLNWSRSTGKKVPTDQELSDILVEVNKDMLELGPANKAYWQGGEGTGTTRQVLGVATQFMQVGAKTMELIMKNEGRGGFTNAQKRRIIMGQMAMFGAAGVPMGGMIAQMISKGAGIEEIHPTVADGLNQGFVGMTVNLALSTGDTLAERSASGVQSSERFALGAQVTQMVADFIQAEDPIWIKAFGPAGSGVFGRMWDAYNEIKVLGQVDWSEHTELTPDLAVLGASVLAQIPSSSRSYWKYHLMTNYNAILDRRKNVTVNADFNELEEIGTLLGFKSNREIDTRMMFLDDRAMKEMVNDYASARISLGHKAVYEMQLDPHAVQAVTSALQMLDSTTPEWVKMKGQEQVIERIFGPRQESTEERQLKKFIERTAVDKITEDAILDSTDPLGTSSKPFTQPFKNWLTDHKESE